MSSHTGRLRSFSSWGADPERSCFFVVLLRMSEGTEVEPELRARALARAERTMERLQIGYVVIDLNRCSPDLIEFAKRAFHLSPVASDEGLELYRTPVAPAVQP